MGNCLGYEFSSVTYMPADGGDNGELSWIQEHLCRDGAHL